LFLINNVCIIHLIVCGANVLSENLFSAICKQVVESDKLVHFANQMGKLVTSTYQQGVIPLMNEEEISQYALRAVVRATTHEDFEKNLGKLQYSVVNYERLIRATIPIPPIEGKNTFFLLMTLNIDSEPKTIIERKVLPIIEQNKEMLNQ
jgi:hypothetical protein